MSQSTITAYGPELLEIVKACAGIIPNRVVLPILHVLRIQAKDLRLSVRSTNLEVSLELETACKGDNGAFLVDAKQFMAAVEAVGLEHARITVEKESIRVRGGTFACKIPTADVSEFPSWPEVKGNAITVKTTELLRRARGCAFAIADSIDRTMLNGININEKMVFAATDGHVMSIFEPLSADGDVGDIIVPLSGLRAITNNAHDDVALASDGKCLSAEFGNGRLVTKLIEGPYPMYRNVTAGAKREKFARVEASALAAAVKSVMPFSIFHAEKKVDLVEIKFSTQGLIILAVGEEADASLMVPAQVHGEHHLRINARYLLEALAVMESPRLDIVVGHPLGPVFIEAAREGDDIKELPERFCVVMPIRIPKEK